MHKRMLLVTLLGLLSIGVHAETLNVKDNGNVQLHLSQTNYNRLLIRGDSLWDFAYPEGALAIKRDGADGSVYLIAAHSEPFTLFLTTQRGRHFTATVTGEVALGKTIELVLQETAKSTNSIASYATNHAVPSIDKEAAKELLTAMRNHQQLPNIRITRQFGKALRGSNGLSILPREHWETTSLQGDIMELYNARKQVLHLAPNWFYESSVIAVQLSKDTLNPYEHAVLYRVKRGQHG